jgi:hypothetical protein
MQTIKVFQVTPSGLIWTGFQIARIEAVIPFITDLALESPNAEYWIVYCSESIEEIDSRKRQTTTITDIIATVEAGKVLIRK